MRKDLIMSTTLDVAAALSAIIWPIVVIIILLGYRNKIPMWVEGIANRITKLGFGGFSLELAVAEAFAPEWSGSAGALDLRHTAMAFQVNDSTARTFMTQLTEESTADYAIVNLGTGEEWLTTRLYIMAIIFAQMKGVEAFVFLETMGSTRKRYIGWAKPENIRWALAKHYSWLEHAFADAYSAILSQHHQPQALIVSNEGRLGYGYSPRDPGASIELLKEYLQRVQSTSPPPLPPVAGSGEWILLDPATNTYEHAAWINSEKLEEILGNDLNTANIHSVELRAKPSSEKLKMLLAMPDRFVAAVTNDQRFEYLVDRRVVLEQVAKTIAADSDSRH
jgi:hypothetical protein